MKYSFEEAIKNKSLHHAFIIEAESDIDKLAFAKDIAKIIIGDENSFTKAIIEKKIDEENHPDVYIVRAEKDVIKVEQIRQFLKDLSKKPLEAKRNIGIVEDGDKLSENGYNRLLKTIEEPNGSSIVMILSDNIMNVPITVRSRCIKVSIDEKKYKISEDDDIYVKAYKLLDLIVNREYFYKKKKFIDDNIKDRSTALAVLDMMQRTYRDILMGERETDYKMSNMEVFRAIDVIENAKIELSFNIKPATVIKKLILIIGG